MLAFIFCCLIGLEFFDLNVQHWWKNTFNQNELANTLILYLPHKMVQGKECCCLSYLRAIIWFELWYLDNIIEIYPSQFFFYFLLIFYTQSNKRESCIAMVSDTVSEMRCPKRLFRVWFCNVKQFASFFYYFFNFSFIFLTSC